MSNECCGKCKHWHKIEESPYKTPIGKCDKIPKGTFYEDCDGESYRFDTEVFEDEIYTDVFECFEEGVCDEV